MKKERTHHKISTMLEFSAVDTLKPNKFQGCN